MIFEFDNQLTPQNLIDVNDIGQCCIECVNKEGSYYYIVIKTSLGTTTIVTCGPVDIDLDTLPNGYTTSLKRMDYKEDKIAKEIKFFLNDRTKKIVEAKEVSLEEALNNFRDLATYLREGGY